jgi:hypothetical protein
LLLRLREPSHPPHGGIVRLTSDGSTTIINGTFDWVYDGEGTTRHLFGLLTTYLTDHLPPGPRQN